MKSTYEKGTGKKGTRQENEKEQVEKQKKQQGQCGRTKAQKDKFRKKCSGVLAVGVLQREKVEQGLVLALKRLLVARGQWSRRQKLDFSLLVTK